MAAAARPRLPLVVPGIRRRESRTHGSRLGRWASHIPKYTSRFAPGQHDWYPLHAARYRPFESTAAAK
jgi:hypothetical protein